MPTVTLCPALYSASLFHKSRITLPNAKKATETTPPKKSQGDDRDKEKHNEKDKDKDKTKAGRKTNRTCLYPKSRIMANAAKNTNTKKSTVEKSALSIWNWVLPEWGRGGGTMG